MQPYCGHQAFDDFDEFTESVRDWDGRFKQLGSGAFHSEFVQYIQKDIQFMHARVNQHVEQDGCPPKGLRTFSIPAVPHIRMSWCGVSVPVDSVLIFQPARGLDCVTWSDFDIYNISMPQERIEQLCHELGLGSLPEAINQSDIIRCKPDDLAAIRRMFATVADRLKQSPDDAALWVQKELEYGIPTMLLRALASAQEIVQAHPRRMRDTVIRQITAYLDELPGGPPKVYDLCDRFNVSERTLEYAFGDYFGTTPKEYLKRRCLNQVRKILRKRHRKKTTIADIAYRYGFWHMGQFAADYRKLFGELPSETYKRI